MQEGKSGLEKITENFFFFCLFVSQETRKKEKTLSVCAQDPCPCLQCSSSVPGIVEKVIMKHR